MKKKVAWLVVTGWMVAALLLASCAPATVKEEEKVAPPQEKKEAVAVPKEVVVPKEKTNMVKWTGKKLDGTVVERILENPRYGGTFIRARGDDPVYWDTAIYGSSAWADDLIINQLNEADWTRGPVGTGEWSGLYSFVLPTTLAKGGLVESWERPDPTTLIYKIQQGVHFALDPTSEASRLVGGREMTADDVVYNLRYVYHPKSYLGMGYTAQLLRYPDNLEKSIHVSSDDPWKVVYELSPGGALLSGELIGNWGAHFSQVVAPEVLEKYGKPLVDWRHVVGTGPFILKDYVRGSVLTFVKNPDYWKRDPFFPENQLPYIDNYRYLIVPDLSTRLAGLRTGKIDQIEGVLLAEHARTVLETNPEMRSARALGGGVGMAPRNDVKPFDDVRVRRALNMAINKKEIAETLYAEGGAEVFNFQVPPYPDFVQSGGYVPLEKMPRSVQELYEYQPDKAKQLLAEAGYPNGFQTEVLVGSQDMAEMAAVIKGYWAKIGVDLKIDVREFSVYSTMWGRKAYKQMIMNGGLGSGAVPYAFLWVRKDSRFNSALLDLPWIEEKIMPGLRGLYWEGDRYIQFPNIPLGELLPDVPEAKGKPSLNVYANEQAFYIMLPLPYGKVLWQPWVKQFEGAQARPGYGGEAFPQYIWIDQKLKKAMGY